MICPHCHEGQSMIATGEDHVCTHCGCVVGPCPECQEIDALYPYKGSKKPICKTCAQFFDETEAMREKERWQELEYQLWRGEQ